MLAATHAGVASGLGILYNCLNEFIIKNRFNIFLERLFDTSYEEIVGEKKILLLFGFAAYISGRKAVKSLLNFLCFSVGYRIEYDHNGIMTSKSSVARQPGTTVTLKNLFKTLPVRYKELQRNIKKVIDFDSNIHILRCRDLENLTMPGLFKSSCMYVLNWS